MKYRWLVRIICAPYFWRQDHLERRATQEARADYQRHYST
jgi:hypothetical protein